MKKMLCCLSVISSLVATSAFATNKCIENISAHYTHGWLDLQRCDLEARDMTDVVKFISNNKVNYLLLDDNNIRDEGVSILSKITFPVYLSLNNTSIGDKSLVLLSYSNSISYLFVGDNSITDDSVGAFAVNSPVRYLAINNNSITSNAIAELINMGTLETLDVSSNRLDDASAILLQSSQLVGINLDDNEITDKGVEALSYMENLRELSLAANPITPQAIKTFEKNNDRLEGLDLSYDKIDSGSIATLVKMPHLFVLQLDGDQLSDPDAIALSNARLGVLALNNNHISARGAEALAKDGSLYTLLLANNYIGDEGASAIAKDPKLSDLDLSNNYIGPKGAEALAKCAASWWGTLDLDKNAIGDAGAIALAKGNNSYGNLSLKNCQISDAGASSLATLTGTDILYVDYNHISGTGLAALYNNPHFYYVGAEGNDTNAKQVKADWKKQARDMFAMNAIKRMCERKHGKACDALATRHYFLK